MLCSAASKGNLEVVKFLVLEEDCYIEGLSVAEWERCDRYSRSEDYDRELNQRPLTLACKNGHWKVAKFLVEQGAEIGPALFKVAENGDLEATKFLVEHQKKEYIDDHDYEGSDYDDKESAPIHIAAANGHLKVVQYLVEQGADKDNVDGNGDTPLLRAATSEDYGTPQG